MQHNENVLNWFEIPVKDYQRAKKFYETIFAIKMSENKMGEYMMGFFPSQGTGKISGAIVLGEGYEPSASGTVVYFNGDPDLQVVLDKVEQAGGKILMPKTQITPEIGYFAFILDSEGNKLGLHSMK